MKGKTLRNLMLTMLVLGVAGSVVGIGTYATFNATVTSTGNTFATGTFTFSMTEYGGTCTDASGASSSGTCAAYLTGINAPFTGWVPGSSWLTYTTLNNASTSPSAVTATVAFSDSASNALTNNGVDSNSTTTQEAAGLGLVMFECQTNAGADVACNNASLQKLDVIYGNCGGGAGTVLTRGLAGAIATTDVTQPSSTDNGIKVFGTECYGGDNATPVTNNGLNKLGSAVNIIGTGLPATTLAKNTSYNVLMLFYLPNTASNSLAGLTGNSLTATFTANSVAGASQ